MSTGYTIHNTSIIKGDACEHLDGNIPLKQGFKCSGYWLMICQNCDKKLEVVQSKEINEYAYKKFSDRDITYKKIEENGAIIRFHEKELMLFYSAPNVTGARFSNGKNLDDCTPEEQLNFSKKWKTNEKTRDELYQKRDNPGRAQASIPGFKVTGEPSYNGKPLSQCSIEEQEEFHKTFRGFDSCFPT